MTLILVAKQNQNFCNKKAAQWLGQYYLRIMAVLTSAKER